MARTSWSRSNFNSDDKNGLNRRRQNRQMAKTRPEKPFYLDGLKRSDASITTENNPYLRGGKYCFPPGPTMSGSWAAPLARFPVTANVNSTRDSIYCKTFFKPLLHRDLISDRHGKLSTRWRVLKQNLGIEDVATSSFLKTVLSSKCDRD